MEAERTDRMREQVQCEEFNEKWKALRGEGGVL